MTKYISEYILRSEYECSHCHTLPPDIQWNIDHLKSDLPYMYQELFGMFSDLRKEWGKAIPLTGYRCIKYNTQLANQGLASYVSAHIFGLGLDCNFKTVEKVTEFSNLVEDIHPELRMGVYKDRATFIHLDNAYVISPRVTPKWREGARWYG